MFGLFKKKDKKVVLYAVCDGELMTIDQVSDPVFSQKMMGDGFAIKPSNGKIYSPLEGKVSSVFPTKHAIGLEVGDLEILLHMGLDTVALEGGPFTSLVEDGVKVTPETGLSEVDLAALEEADKDDVMLVVFTNGDQAMENFQLTAQGIVKQGQEIGYLELK